MVIRSISIPVNRFGKTVSVSVSVSHKKHTDSVRFDSLLSAPEIVPAQYATDWPGKKEASTISGEE